MANINKTVNESWLPVAMIRSKAKGATENDMKIKVASFGGVECGLFARYEMKEYPVTVAGMADLKAAMDG